MSNRACSTASVLILVAAGHVLAQEAPDAPAPAPKAPPFLVRPGYEVTVAADDFPAARFMEFDDKGTLYVSNPGGEILSLRDLDHDGFYETRGTFSRNMKSVHGLCWANGWLWFTTSGVVWKARDLDGDGDHDELVEVTRDTTLSQGGNHWMRSILVTRTHFFTSIGDSGNITDESGTDRQKIWRFNLDGSGKTLFASGIRNTEKLRFRPGTEEIWGIDHGSDNFGKALGERTGSVQPVTDFNPPDELNKYVEGGFYGHPFITGYRLPRYEFRERRDIVDLAAKTVVPEWTFPAHSAANAFCFIDPEVNDRTHAFPADHNGDLFVACRGSWNRTVKIGYQICRVMFDPWTGAPYGMQTIVSTLDANGRTLARPVDCVQAPDGSVLWSCDETNAVYRLRYTGLAAAKE
ncbi:MAG: PQQ-dependent sugar dehydrogenase [Phycisphaerae bacterium]|nr:PQQ-dependent sugar dehydrogenase [Phycisphaerae bacterium]